VRTKLLVLLLSALAVFGCAKEPGKPAPSPGEGQEAAIEAAVKAYLAGRSDLALDNMEIEFRKISVQGDTAEAEVVFRTKNGQGEMPISYKLAREAGNWVVQRKRPEASTGPMPPGHPPVPPPGPEPAH
jgi:hypothetical protein